MAGRRPWRLSRLRDPRPLTAVVGGSAGLQELAGLRGGAAAASVRGGEQAVGEPEVDDVVEDRWSLGGGAEGGVHHRGQPLSRDRRRRVPQVPGQPLLQRAAVGRAGVGAGRAAAPASVPESTA